MSIPTAIVHRARHGLVIACALAACALATGGLLPGGAAIANPSIATIPAAGLLQPAEFAARLRDPAAPPVLILQVGFRALFEQAHIPGAEYWGAAGDAKDLARLRARAATLSKDTDIVIYCGCCPWTHCPNMAAAYSLLQGLGFHKLKALYLANDFGTDWVERGYPVSRAP